MTTSTKDYPIHSIVEIDELVIPHVYTQRIFQVNNKVFRESDGDNFNDLHQFALLGEQDITIFFDKHQLHGYTQTLDRERK